MADLHSTANLSPVGWYVASYLIRFVEVGAPDNDDPDRRFLTWENTILVQARDLHHAYDKAVAFAQRATEPYASHPTGEPVQWLFEGLTELLPIYEDLADGAEIMWADRRQRKLSTLRRWSQQRDDFVR